MSASIIYSETAAYRTTAEIECLVRNFESCLLPRDQWTHRAHLTVALWYLLRHQWPEAVRRTRENIKRYNEAGGILTTRERGYHETITLFWLRMVRLYLETASRECSLVALFNGMVDRYGDKSLPLKFYTRERLMSGEARARWIEPDLKSLDEV
ncbi:MAG TPA: hypothetical protein VGX92_09000 [Pyrinomonadaceae bacterium]|jgi:hypothetical protein|nr:hypothetical protein [Pyrinomonadaceae bacterium]